MGNTLVIYDTNGRIFFQGSGNLTEPIGIPFLWVEVPEKKRAVSVDVSVTPNIAVFEDIPPSKVDVLNAQVANLTYELMLKGVL